VLETRFFWPMAEMMLENIRLDPAEPDTDNAGEGIK